MTRAHAPLSPEEVAERLTPRFRAVILYLADHPGWQPGADPEWRPEVFDVNAAVMLRSMYTNPSILTGGRHWRDGWYRFALTKHGIAVSYQDEALHRGDLYRFDGWLLIGKGGGGGKDSRTGRLGRRMKIWAWPPDRAAALVAADARGRT